MIRWKAAIKDIHLHPQFQQIVDYIFDLPGPVQTVKDLREAIRAHGAFKAVFNIVNIEFDESGYVPNGGEVG